MISYDEFKNIVLKTAKVINAEDVEGSKNLYKLTLDVGGEKRTIVSGIKNSYTKEELLGKTIILVYNLEPRTVFGIKSEGMLLAVEEKGKVVLLTTEKEVSSGLRVL